MEHFRLLKESGLIDATFTQFLEDRVQPVAQIRIDRLTWAGHEFLSAVRSDTVWQKTKGKVAAVGGSVSLGTLTEVASAVAKALLQLPA